MGIVTYLENKIDPVTNHLIKKKTHNRLNVKIFTIFATINTMFIPIPRDSKINSIIEVTLMKRNVDSIPQWRTI